MAAQEVTLPDYVEYGGRVTAPGEFDCSGGHFRAFVLDGDKHLIGELVDRMFNRPARGDVSFRALTDKVVALIGWFDTVRAMTSPWDAMGSVREEQLSLWVPVAQGHEERGRFVAERLLMAVPFIFVDNPMSYAGGRETYGFPKSLGRFTFHDGIDGDMTASTYGGDYDTGARADWCKVMKIDRKGAGVPGDVEHLDGEQAFIDHITEGRLDPDHPPLLHGEIQILEQAIRDALAGRSHQLFLKQFRDATLPGAACFQEIVEAPIQITDTSSDYWPGVWRVEVGDPDSHPIARELGVRSQTTLASYSVEMSFICGRGTRVWPKTASSA
jgi:hypothetical protein